MVMKTVKIYKNIFHLMFKYIGYYKGELRSLKLFMNSQTWIEGFVNPMIKLLQ